MANGVRNVRILLPGAVLEDPAEEVRALSVTPTVWEEAVDAAAPGHADEELRGRFVIPGAWQEAGEADAAALRALGDSNNDSDWCSARSRLPTSKKRPSIADAASAVLQINVGGVLFNTSVATLRRAPFFESLLKYSQQGTLGTTIDPSGHLFVDRPGDLFAYILEYLQCGRWISSGNIQPDAAFVEALQAEAAFYGLDACSGNLPRHEVSEYIVAWQFREDKFVYLDCLEQTIREDPDHHGLFRVCKHSGGLPLDQLTNARRFKAATQSMQAVLKYFKQRGFDLQHVLEPSMVTHTMSASGQTCRGFAVQYILCRRVLGSSCWPGCVQRADAPT